MQIHRKFPNVPVAVCANRLHGIKQLQKLVPHLQVVILDDALQHRALQCTHTVLLTAADNLYVEDHLLPWGYLRDLPYRSLCAQTVIVTKCPQNMKPIDKRVIHNKLHLAPFQNLYFSHIEYEPIAEDIKHPLLVCGIANPQPLIDHIRKQCKRAQVMTFADHHQFTNRDIARIMQAAEHCDCVLTTEKDYERLLLTRLPEALGSKLQSIPIRVELDHPLTFKL